MTPDALTMRLWSRVRAARRQPLFPAADVPRLDDGAALVRRLLPHRGRMLLVDALVGFDARGGRIVGRRRLAAEDPGFTGHFPGDPIYPGALQLEAVGQCGLCLRPLRACGSAAPPPAARPAAVRLVRILAAEFHAPVRPGADALLLAELVEDGPTLLTVGQMLVDGRPTCAAAFEAIVFDAEGDDG